MIGNYYEPSEGSNPVMSELMFEGIRDFFFEDLEEENESTEIQQFLKHVQLTHNRATFDAFNEILEGMRPSASYPWRQCTITQKAKHFGKGTLAKLFETAKSRLFEFITTLCGFIHDKDDCQFQIDERQLAQIKEDRMSKMLTQSVHYLYIILYWVAIGQ